MQRGHSFEKQIDKVIEYIESIGFHGHKNNAKRLKDGTYIQGEPFDFEIFLPNRHDCFDTKQCKTDIWDIVPKDIKQANELKKCKNAGCNAYFLICFKGKEVKVIDVDTVIKTLKNNKKSIKNINLPDWDLIKQIKEMKGTKEL